MQAIEGILFEPVGCLAEFPSEQFLEIAAHLFGRRKKASQSGSRSYWHLLNLIESANKKLDESERQPIEALEVQAVAAATPYDNLAPPLPHLNTLAPNPS